MKKQTTSSYHMPVACIVVPLSVSQYGVDDSVSQMTSVELSRLSFRTDTSDTSTSVSNLSSSHVGSPIPKHLHNHPADMLVNEMPCVMELRERFDVYLNGSPGTGKMEDVDGMSRTNYNKPLNHKLLFLDEFYDAQKQRMRKFHTLEELFSSCDRFLMMLIKMANVQVKWGETMKPSYPYLTMIDEIVNTHSKSIPLLDNHEYLVSWLTQQSRLAIEYLEKQATQHDNEDVSDLPIKNEPFVSPSESLHSQLTDTISSSATSQSNTMYKDTVKNNCNGMESYDYSGLKMLLFMYTNELEDHFSLFQKSNHKYFRKWLETNIKQLPNYVKDLIHKKRKNFLHFLDTTKFKEEDLNLKILLDSDFEFINHLCEHTEDWKVLNADSPQITAYKSKMNYSAVKEMKLQKYITTVDYSIEKCLKTLLTDDTFGEDNGLLMSTQYHHYQPLDPNLSSKKYSTVVQTSLLNYGALFRKRSLENVISTRATFCGNELQEAIHLYKTCSYVSDKNDSKSPLKIIIIGGRLFTKDDSNRTRIVETRMFNMGGSIMNSDFVVHSLASKKMIDDLASYLKSSMAQAETTGFQPPSTEKGNIWQTLVDYCRVNHNVDINQW